MWLKPAVGERGVRDEDSVVRRSQMVPGFKGHGVTFKRVNLILTMMGSLRLALSRGVTWSTLCSKKQLCREWMEGEYEDPPGLSRSTW